MDYHPITEAQEQELREWARRAWRSEGVRHVELAQAISFVASTLAYHVFQGGRLTNTVSFETRCQIAREEKGRIYTR